MAKKRRSSRRRSSGGRGGRVLGKARGFLNNRTVQRALVGIGGGTAGSAIGGALGGEMGSSIGRAGGAFLTGGIEGVAADQVLALATGQPNWISMMMGGIGGAGGSNGGGNGGSL